MKHTISKRRKRFLIIWLSAVVVLLGAVMLTLHLFPPVDHAQSIKEIMKDAVLHDRGKVAFFGMSVNPAVPTAYIVTALLLSAAALIRIFAIPRFGSVPGKFQSIIEILVAFFSGMARKNSPQKSRFIGAYIFSAGVYVAFSTLFELFGIQTTTTNGTIITLPAPLSDINAALAMGLSSFGVIFVSGVVAGGWRGIVRTLRDVSLPISMSFRLFGALLSGLLVTELVYHSITLSFFLPVLVGILFTLVHALMQAYVLSTLVSIFYGEAVETHTCKSPVPNPNQEVP